MCSAIHTGTIQCHKLLCQYNVSRHLAVNNTSECSQDTDLPQMDKTAGRNYFRRGFQKFCKRYTSWLKEIVPEKLGHPWDQFQKNAQTDMSIVKEDIRNRRQSKIKN